MIAYIARRLLLALVTCWAISVLSFVIIQLPPGDYVTTYIAELSADGTVVSLLFGAASFIVGAIGGLVWVLSTEKRSGAEYAPSATDQ